MSEVLWMGRAEGKSIASLGHTVASATMFGCREIDRVRHSANGRRGKRILKKTAYLRLIKLSRL